MYRMFNPFQVEYHHSSAKLVLLSEFKFPYERSLTPVSERIFDDRDRSAERL